MQALVVHSPFHLMVLNATVILWLAPEWIGSFFQRPESGAVNRDRGSHAVLVVSLIAGIFAAWCCVSLIPATNVVWQQQSIFWCGIALMLGGVAFRWYAIRALGQYFTRDVSTRDGQTVVEHGPYRWIRHPSYTGALLTVFGFGLAMTNWLALLATMLGALIGYGYRVRVEEAALCTALGDPYREYMQRTRRFIPLIW